MLAARIKLIEERKRKPEKGDDILLSVITDGRHAAIDMRFVRRANDDGFDDDEPDHKPAPAHDNEPGNKLNALIVNAHRIWLETADRVYRRPDGTP